MLVEKLETQLETFRTCSYYQSERI